MPSPNKLLLCFAAVMSTLSGSRALCVTNFSYTHEFLRRSIRCRYCGGLYRSKASCGQHERRCVKEYTEVEQVSKTCLVCFWQCATDNVLAIHMEQFHPSASGGVIVDSSDSESLRVVDGSLGTPENETPNLRLENVGSDADYGSDAGSDEGFGAALHTDDAEGCLLEGPDGTRISVPSGTTLNQVLVAYDEMASRRTKSEDQFSFMPLFRDELHLMELCTNRNLAPSVFNDIVKWSRSRETNADLRSHKVSGSLTVVCE